MIGKPPVLWGLKSIKMNNRRNGCRRVEYLFCNKMKWGWLWLFCGASSSPVCQVLFWVSEKQHVSKKECKNHGLLYTLPICCAVPGNVCIWCFPEDSKFFCVWLLCLKISAMWYLIVLFYLCIQISEHGLIFQILFHLTM